MIDKIKAAVKTTIAFAKDLVDTLYVEAKRLFASTAVSAGNMAGMVPEGAIVTPNTSCYVMGATVWMVYFTAFKIAVLGGIATLLSWVVILSCIAVFLNVLNVKVAVE